MMPALAQTPAALDAARSEIVFVSKQLGVPVEGRFKRFDARIALDPQNPEGGSVAFDIDTRSAELGIAEADAELPNPLWFDSAKFPRATFQSTSIKSLGGGRMEVAGSLRIKSVARDVVVPVTLTRSGAVSTATGRFTLRRLDFKIGEGEWSDTSIVANDVQVVFKLVLTGLGAP